MLALLAEFEAFAVAILLTVRVDFDGVITDLNLTKARLHLNDADLAPRTASDAPVNACAAAAGFMLSFAATGAAVGPIEAFIIIVVSTTIPY